MNLHVLQVWELILLNVALKLKPVPQILPS